MEILRMVGIGKSFGGGPVLENVPKEITLYSRVFTKENVDAGGEWLKKP